MLGRGSPWQALVDGGNSYIIRFPPAGSIWPAGTTPPRCNMPLISPPHKASSWVSSGKGLRLQKHPSLTRALSLVSCSVGSILKFLNLFALNLYFVNEVRWDRGAQWREEETHSLCQSFFPAPVTQSIQSLEHRTPGSTVLELQRLPASPGGTVWRPCGGEQGAAAREGLFPVRTRTCILRNMNNQGNLSYSWYFPTLADHFCWEIMSETHVGKRGSHCSFSPVLPYPRQAGGSVSSARLLEGEIETVLLRTKCMNTHKLEDPPSWILATEWHSMLLF